MKKLFKFYLGRIIINGLFLLIQLLVIIGGCCYICLHWSWINAAINIFALFLSLKIAVQRCNIPCRIGWIIGVLFLPVLFIPMYLMYGRGTALKKIQRKLDADPMPLQPSVEIDAPLRIKKQLEGLSKVSGFPTYKNECEYLSTGEEFFKAMKDDLSRAKKYIFLEFFIINYGYMWDQTLEILSEKAKQGVKIYILYDDMGTIALLSPDFCRKMKEKGINAKIFNLFKGRITAGINYRDHRKIVVVDGQYAITGGANIADEYINKISPYGYWKDTAIRVEGESAETFAAMFIQMWNMDGQHLDYADFMGFVSSDQSSGIEYAVLPFGDYPMCSIGFSERAFLNMINNAQKEIVITTPYFIPDSRLLSALCLASENGITVRLFTPEIPDKKYIHILTRANYITLLKSGVEIYEFSDGFIHSKSIICDKEISYVGSANLDYRSLYIHFESGAVMYKTKSTEQLARDLDKLLKLSKKISLSDPQIIKADKNIIYRFLRIFSGLL